jgi:hypothetical protein
MASRIPLPPPPRRDAPAHVRAQYAEYLRAQLDREPPPLRGWFRYLFIAEYRLAVVAISVLRECSRRRAISLVESGGDDWLEAAARLFDRDLS